MKLTLRCIQAQHNCIFLMNNSWPQTYWASLMAQLVKNLLAMWETWVRSLGWKDPLEKGMITHSSILAWRIPWTEGPRGLWSMGLQRVRHSSWLSTDTCMQYFEVSRTVCLQASLKSPPLWSSWAGPSQLPVWGYRVCPPYPQLQIKYIWGKKSPENFKK